jgi:hypothetical protein
MYGLAPFVGQWNDYENNATVPPEPLLFGVVEIVPEPSVCALLAGAGLVGLLKKFGKRGE